MSSSLPIGLFSLCALMACAPSTPEVTDPASMDAELRQILEEAPVLAADPRTPEEVFRNWHLYMDRNAFDDAERLSTAPTRDWIRTIRSMVEHHQGDTSPVHTAIEGVQCESAGDTATCFFAETVGNALRLDSVQLIRESGIWKVHLPAQGNQDRDQ